MLMGSMHTRTFLNIVESMLQECVPIALICGLSKKAGQHLAYRCKTAAMVWGHAVLVKCGKVSFGAIAFVLIEAIGGIFGVQLQHKAITGNFSDDRGGGDRETARITLNDRA